MAGMMAEPWEVRRWGTNDDPWPINRVSIGPRGRAIVISPKYADVDDEAKYRLIAAAPRMLEALEKIALGEGRFSRDQLTHASNTIEDMKALANAAIAKATGEA